MQIQRTKLKTIFLAGALASCLTTAAEAQRAPATVTPEHVRAHVDYLAGPALRGRASATPDEAAAAAYVAAMFRGYGLAMAPGLTGYTQTADVTTYKLNGPAMLTANGVAVASPLLFSSTGQPIAGKLTVYAGTDPAQAPAADVLIATNPAIDPLRFAGTVDASKVKLVIVRATADVHKYYDIIGGSPRLPRTFKGEAPRSRRTVLALEDAAFDALAAQPGADISLTLPGLVQQDSVTTNALGFLPGTDPAAGVLLVTAHLDHLGVRPDGKVMYGANDDASGTAAVLELARTLVGRKHRRGILFVAYGSEEAGGFGARWFAEHPPVPLTDIVANLEIEMIGQQDPKLPQGTMMMTGYERSTFGETLKAHGALVTTDPYPEENFFQRSDNYALALKGVVAHTVSGWATVPTYHTPEDTVANLNIPFMAQAIQSLVKPLASLADSKAKPEWKPGGRPTAQ